MGTVINQPRAETERPFSSIGVSSDSKGTRKYYYASLAMMGLERKALTTKDTKVHEGILEGFGFPS
jgi:hypothetical protein